MPRHQQRRPCLEWPQLAKRGLPFDVPSVIAGERQVLPAKRRYMRIISGPMPRPAAARFGLLARVAHAQGLSTRVLSPETIRQALARQPRPCLYPQKNRRERMIDMARHRPGWVLGFADEVWFSRRVHA